MLAEVVAFEKGKDYSARNISTKKVEVFDENDNLQYVVCNKKISSYGNLYDTGYYPVEKTGNKFNVDLENARPEIITSISKLSNVKSVSEFSIDYKSEFGEILNWEDIKSRLNKTYFSIKYHITSNIG